ncbi:MAG TPA: hypothetical protein VLA75_00065 [Thermoanaerobaculia bacterium]|nr:hypothetical protein [Thermoanaerobaculia bacterium]
MRKQYFFRPSRHGYYAWDVDRLTSLAATLEAREVPLSQIKELDLPFRLEGSDEVPTYREVAEHARWIEVADLRFPIILASDGRVMDGMHRVLKALNGMPPTARRSGRCSPRPIAICARAA